MHKLLRKFLRFLELNCRSSRGILMKFWGKCKKILKKFRRNWEENFKWFQANYGNIINIEVIRIWCRYKEIVMWSEKRQIRKTRYWENTTSSNLVKKYQFLIFNGNIDSSASNILTQIQVSSENSMSNYSEKCDRYAANRNHIQSCPCSHRTWFPSLLYNRLLSHVLLSNLVVLRRDALTSMTCSDFFVKYFGKFQEIMLSKKNFE